MKESKKKEFNSIGEDDVIKDETPSPEEFKFKLSKSQVLCRMYKGIIILGKRAGVKGSYFTCEELAEKAGEAYNQIYVKLKELDNQGFIVKKGKGVNVCWHLKDEFISRKTYDFAEENIHLDLSGISKKGGKQ